ncbi:MAG TPA: HypC/HybG/HupF family hydrogenase formation chaperone [Chloroflexia bacterium]|nr:HypC/HybG/HupF family hydrogenase formation chaperone [Chloroflexia bacterium]
MCLGVPGKVLSIEHNGTGLPTGKVSFGGITKDVCLAYAPDARVGDYVIVHVGFAISRIDEEEARAVFSYLERMEELAELDVPQPA